MVTLCLDPFIDAQGGTSYRSSVERTQIIEFVSSSTERSELELMRLLDAKQQLSQREFASSLGVSLGKVNYCLRALIDKGFVKVGNYRNSRNRLAYFYLLTPSGIAAKTDLARRFLTLKMKEYDELRLEIERLKQETARATAAE